MVPIQKINLQFYYLGQPMNQPTQPVLNSTVRSSNAENLLIKKVILALGACLVLTLARADEVANWPRLDFPFSGVGLEDLPGRAILVNDSLENVKARLSKQWPDASWEEDKGYLRDAYKWQYLWLKKAPTAISKQESDLETILAAAQHLVITSGEKEQLIAERRRLLVTDGAFDRAQDDRIFDRAYLRISYFSQGKLSRKGKHDYAALIDVAPALHTDKPVTLLWVSSVDVSTSHRFSLMQCMTGVACFPIPTIDTDYSTVPVERSRFTQAVSKAIDGLDLRTVQDSDLHLDDYYDQLRSHDEDVPLPTVDAGTAPLVDSVVMPLPVDSRAPRGLQIAAVAGDRLLLYSTGDGLATQLREISWAQGEFRNVTLANDIQLSRLYPDLKGFWAVGSVQIQHFGPHGIQTFQPDQQGRKTYFAPREWQVLPGVGLVNSASADAQGTLMLRPDGSGTWLKIPPARQRAIGTVYAHTGIQAMILADRKLWFKDAFVFGFDPLSQKIEGSLPGRRHADFGSLAGGWGVTCAYSNRCTAFDLHDQAPAWVFPNDNNMFALARTAHGKLLAVGNGFGSVSLWDMPSQRPIARVSTPEGMKLIDLSFSWSGDKVWLLYESPDAQGTMSLRSWDIPTQFRDPANGMNIPYRFRTED